MKLPLDVALKYAKKQAWTCFINAGGVETATVKYWISQLSREEKSKIKSAMKVYGNQPSEEQGEQA